MKEWNEEGSTFLVIEKTTQQAVGLMILFEMQTEEGNGEAEVRLGYLLSEATWGKGIAAELVSGFVCWCRGQESMRSDVNSGHESFHAASSPA